ncbi:MAG TPA: YceD family protein [Solimonas sp.]
MAVPQRVKASGAVAQSARYEGALPVSALPRLCAALVRDDEVVEVHLQVSRAMGRVALQGTLQGSLSLQCRRCDRTYAWPLHSSVDLRLVDSDDEERALLESADPYRVEDDQLPLHEMIEDEVLLALPMLPRCPTCETLVQDLPAPQGADAVPEQRENPFAALKGRFKQDQ